jgi:hypothetical protein
MRIIGFLLTLVLLFPIEASAATEIRAGSLLNGVMLRELYSKTARDGDPFSVQTGGGSTLYGHLTQVSRARINRQAHIRFVFDRIDFPDGTEADLQARLITLSGKKKKIDYIRTGGRLLAESCLFNGFTSLLERKPFRFGRSTLGSTIFINVLASGILLVMGKNPADMAVSDFYIPRGSRVSLEVTSDVSHSAKRHLSYRRAARSKHPLFALSFSNQAGARRYIG